MPIQALQGHAGKWPPMNASAYTPLRPLRSRHVALRHISMHLSEWGAPPGDADAPLLVLLHGWMDVGASFQFVADAFSDGFARSRRMVAPDWRGFGLTRQSGPVDHYTIADCLGDLDALLMLLAPDGAPVDLAGHSLGGHIAMLYAGARPQRVRRVVNLEGFGLPAAAPEQAPARMAQWLDELARLHQGQAGLKPYANAAAVAERLRQNNPRLPADKALWLAGHWAQPDGQGLWRVLGDPAHKVISPYLFRLEETLAAYRAITAPVLAAHALDEKGRDSLGLLWRGQYTLAEYLERMRSVPDCRIEAVQGAGHMLHHDQPQAVARLMESFL